MNAKGLKKIAVIGLGKMGGDWVVNLLEGGYEVVGYDSSKDCRDSVEDRVKKGLAWVAKKRKGGDEAFAGEAWGRFTLAETEAGFLESAKSAQIFLEVVFEDLKLKCQLLSRMVPQLPEDVVVWTNTSSLSVITMGESTGRVEKFLGTHGMNPVYQMPAVEVIAHDKVDDQVLRASLEVLESLGKIPFVARDVPGFWVNKLLIPFMMEAMRALERGEITVEDGDKGLKNSLGHPQGVFKLSDFIGSDTMYRVAMAMYLASQDPRCYPPTILTRMFKNGEFGVKTGKGFYEWDGFKIVKPRDFTEVQIKDANTLLDF